MATNFWTTRDGRRVDLRAMDDEHILNALRMGFRAQAMRAQRTTQAPCFVTLIDDCASQLLGRLDRDWERTQERNLASKRNTLTLPAHYAPLLQEANRRGLRLSRARSAVC